jgi:hypothetical protein
MMRIVELYMITTCKTLHVDIQPCSQISVPSQGDDNATTYPCIRLRYSWQGKSQEFCSSRQDCHATSSDVPGQTSYTTRCTAPLHGDRTPA